MNLPTPGRQWNQAAEAALRDILVRADAQNLKRGQPAEVDDLSVGGKVGFYSTDPAPQPTVTGSLGGNAALASLVTALADLGLIVDGTSP